MNVVRPFRPFWMSLFSDTINRVTAEPLATQRFDDCVKGYLAYELPPILAKLPELAFLQRGDGSRGVDDHIAILTYYSTMFPAAQEHMGYRRVPVTSLDAAIEDESSSVLLLKKERATLEAGTASARASARAFMEGAPTLSPAAGTDATPEAKCDAFLTLMQRDVLAPVNIAEALGVDMHLPESLYRAHVDEHLFGASNLLPGDKAELLRAWADLDALDDELAPSAKKGAQLRAREALDAPLFTTEATNAAVSAMTNANAELRRVPMDASSRSLLAAQTLMARAAAGFRFELQPPTGDVEATVGSRQVIVAPSQLHALAAALLYGRDRTRTAPPTIGELWKEDTENIPAEYTSSAHPSLPFFLLALYWGGTYRDLIRFVLPPFVLDATDLRVETPDYCAEAEFLLYRLARHVGDAKDPSASLVRQVAAMIRVRAVGSIVVFSRRSGATPKGLPEPTEFQNLSALNGMLRNVIRPLRSAEVAAQIRREERAKHDADERRARALHNAFHDVGHKIQPVANALREVRKDVGKVEAEALKEDGPDKTKLNHQLPKLNRRIGDLSSRFADLQETIKFHRGITKGESESCDPRPIAEFERSFYSLHEIAAVLPKGDSVICKPFVLDPTILPSTQIGLPLRPLYYLVREALINFARYADLSKPRTFRAGIKMDSEHPVFYLEVSNKIPRSLVDSGDDHRVHRTNFLMARKGLLAEPPEVLGDWTGDARGHGVSGAIMNYLIQQFSPGAPLAPPVEGVDGVQTQTQTGASGGRGSYSSVLRRQRAAGGSYTWDVIVRPARIG